MESGGHNLVPVQSSESRLSRFGKELSLVLELSSFLSTSLHLKSILDGALTTILGHFELDAGRIYLLNSGDPFLRLAACSGANPKSLEMIKLTEGFSGKAVRTKSFVAQHVSELEDRLRPDFLAYGEFNMIICIPLLVRNQVIGVLNLASKSMERLDRDGIDLLVAAGNQVAVAASHARLYENLERKEKMMRFFASSVSHDLKGPSVGAYGLARLLKRQCQNVLDEKAKHYCDQIMKATERIVALTGDITAYVAAGESALKLEDTDLKEIIDNLRAEFAPILEERRIRWLQPRRSHTVLVDRELITRALQNLVDNALKYGGETLSAIRIGVRETKDCCIVSVCDDGAGIGDEDVPKLFGAFERGGNSRGISGSGLGLAIVKEASERHHGAAWAETPREKGAKFLISIRKFT